MNDAGNASRTRADHAAPISPIEITSADKPKDEYHGQLDSLSEILRESEDRYRTLFDLSPVAVYSIDPSGVIKEFNANAAALWGASPVLGDTDQRFCGSFKMFLPDGTFLPHDRCPMATVVSGEVIEARDAEVVIERKDGSRVTVIVNIVPLKNQHGEITGAINCFYDITERSRLERETKEQAAKLADLHHRKDEFLAMLSHELRNPLAPISNAVQLLRRQNGEDARQVRALDVIERQVGQLVHLINDLMEMSRITSGKIHLYKKRISMSVAVEQAVETVQPLINQRSHELAISLPEHPVWIDADGVRMEQVIVNLLTNAAKYTEQGGRIWLTVRQENGMMILSVRDSGIGMAPELLPHIFDLFAQATRSLDHSEGGLGIGLSLVRKLVELHDGVVTASSVPGEGSEFVVRIPIAD